MRFLLFLVALTGCTQDFDAFLGDASAPGDATIDAPSDASVDAAKDAASDGGDAGLTFACGTQTVPDCTQCIGTMQPCVYCGSGSGSALAGRCVPQGTSCSFNVPNGFQACSCQSASTCPESYDVCRNGSCRTCSDSANNNGQACKGGGTCTSADGGCN